MTKLDYIQKAIEERFWGMGYYIVDNPEEDVINIIAEDGIFGSKFITFISSLKIDYVLNCQREAIRITREDLQEEKK